MTPTIFHTLARRALPVLFALLPAATVAQPSAAPGSVRCGQIALLGDSNMWLAGDSCVHPQGWPMWFATAFPASGICNFSRSGSTWTNTPTTSHNPQEYTEILSDDNVIYNQIVRLRAAVDSGYMPVPELVLIGAGTNDAWFRKRRPKAFAQTAADAFAETGATTARRPSEVLTLAASVRYGCELLREAFPGVRIVLLTPMQTTAAPDGDIRRAGDIIEGCAERLGAGCIRLDRGTCVVSTQERGRKMYTTDGTHTNVAGARAIGYYVAERLRAWLVQAGEDTGQ